MKNYLTYPCKVMNITQGYTGSYTHSQHNTGSPKDFPWDEACSGSGRDWMYCPCDEMKVVGIYGVGARGTNTLWLQSTRIVFFADGTSGYFVLLITHPNDDDLKKIKKGQIFKRGDKICREGTDGNATGNHFHFSAGKGVMTGNGWDENSKGKWVLTCSVATAKPEQLFYIDPEFTTIKNSKGLKFKELPPVYTKGTYVVTADTLNVRTGPGTNYRKVEYKNFKAAGKRQIKKLKGKDYKKNHFVKGMRLKITKIKNDVWGKCPSGWVHLDYCMKKR